MFTYESQKRTWLVISTVLSRLKDFSSSHAVMYTVNISETGSDVVHSPIATFFKWDFSYISAVGHRISTVNWHSASRCPSAITELVVQYKRRLLAWSRVWMRLVNGMYRIGQLVRCRQSRRRPSHSRNAGDITRLSGVTTYARPSARRRWVLRQVPRWGGDQTQ